MKCFAGHRVHILVATAILAGAAVGLPLEAHQISAGVISGRVVDAAGGAPLVGARIRIAGIRREEMSAENGSFDLRNIPLGTHNLVVQRIGYLPVSRAVQLTASAAVVELTITLTRTPITMSTTVVTGTIGATSASEVLSPTTVVDGAALARKLSGTLAATLRNEPGVSLSGMGPATARPVIRGMGGDRVVVLEDGARPGDLSSTSPDHAVAVDPLTAAQFEVVRGPMSLLYGSSALGGVINTIREEIPTSVDEHIHGAFSLEGTTVNGSGAAGGYATASLGTIAIRGEGSYRVGQNVRTPIGTLENTFLRSYGVAVGASRVYGTGHAGASYRFYDNTYGIPGGFVGAHANGVDIEMQRHSVRAQNEHRPASGLFANIRSDIAWTDYEHSEVQPSGSLTTFFGQTVGSAEILARHEQLGFLTKGAIGIRAQRREVILKGALRTPSTRDYGAAIYFVEEAEVGLFHLQGGLRYDWSRYKTLDPGATVQVGGEDIPALPRTFGSVSGAIGALIHATGDLQIGTSISRAFRTPDFNELYSDGPHLAANSYDVGNPRISQETGIGTDLFARITRPWLRAEIAWFRNGMYNYIYPTNTGETGPQGGRPKFQFVGRDAVLTGAEAALEVSFTSALVLEGHLSYVRGALAQPPDSLPATDTEPAREGARYLPLIPPLNGSIGLRYETPAAFAALGARLAGRQERLGDFEAETPGYASLHASTGVRVQLGERLHTITLRVENIADAEYRDHLSRIKSIMPEAGRSFSLLYRVTF